MQGTALSPTFSAFTYSGGCESYTFTYTAKQTSGSALPACISLTSSTFAISTTDDSLVGTYNVRVTGTINNIALTSTYFDF